MSITLQQINDAVLDNKADFIKKCEENYLNEIKNVVKKIKSNKNVKIIMIAGPSASGKTTTSKILKSLLYENGVKSETVSLDDFYLEPERSPILPDGTRDIESVNALDIEEIHTCFSNLINNGKVRLPLYDFKTGTKRHNVREADIANGLLIAEGLHALNPVICENLPQEKILKVYISVGVPVSDNSGNTLLSSKKVRLIRRIIRDIKFRNSSVEKTLSLWDNVLAEEERSLYRYKKTADISIATLHPYELCVYKDLLDEVDLSVSKTAPNYEYYMKTINGLMMFEEIDDVTVPYNSLLREFIGDGEYN